MRISAGVRFSVSALLILSLLLVACGSATPTPSLTPTPRPTATIPPVEAFRDMRFVIEYDGQPVATEELFAQYIDQGLLVTSELRRLRAGYPLERRALLLSADLKPLSYEVSLGTAHAESLWLATISDGSVSILANNLQLPGPVVGGELPLVPELFLERTPSALAFAWLVLQLTEGVPEESSRITVMDIMADLPVTSTVTITRSSSARSTVIGTSAFTSDADIAAPFTLWLRHADRSVYVVEFNRYTFYPWLVRSAPELGAVQRVTIRRVNTLPALPPAAGTLAAGEVTSYRIAGGADREGMLFLPDQEAPFPCLVLDTTGLLSPFSSVQAALLQGWAVFIYDRSSPLPVDGNYSRGELAASATAALGAAEMLRARVDIGGPLVFVGTHEGALVGALTAAQPGGYDGYILLSNPLLAPVSDEAFALTTARLAQYYSWDEDRAAAFTGAALGQWEKWLFDGLEELVVSGRRLDLRPLQELRDIDPQRALGSATEPVLVLVGGADPWLDAAQVDAIIGLANQSNGGLVQLQVVEGWDGAVHPGQDQYLVAAAVDPILFAWLDNLAGE